jgi:hypothetical protein
MRQGTGCGPGNSRVLGRNREGSGEGWPREQVGIRQEQGGIRRGLAQGTFGYKAGTGREKARAGPGNSRV